MLGVLVAFLAMAGPSGGVTKEQLEYSKKLFAEGEAAMKKGDYPGAIAKYHEAYRYAPHLHLFNYNIAAAADAMGDCKTARTYYERFVDLVQKHPERAGVKKKLAQYGPECRAAADPAPVVSTEDSKESPTAKARSGDRKREEAEKAMNEAVFQMRVAATLYKDAKAKHKKKTRTFNFPAFRKKWHAKRLGKLRETEGVKADERELPTPDAPLGKSDACRIAQIQENRLVRALEEAQDKFDSQESYRVFSRLLKGTERDLEKFEACQ